MEIGVIRKQLKEWEKQFHKENGRKPSKVCICVTNIVLKYSQLPVWSAIRRCSSTQLLLSIVPKPILTTTSIELFNKFVLRTISTVIDI